MQPFRTAALLTLVASACSATFVDLVFYGSPGCSVDKLAGPFHFFQPMDKCVNLGTLITPLPQFIAYNNSASQIQFTVSGPLGCDAPPAFAAPHGIGCVEAPNGESWEFMTWF